MARSILVFSVVISIVGALNSGEAQPPSLDGLPDDLDNALIATPPSAPAPRLAPTPAPPASSSYGAHPYGTLVIGPPDTPRVRPTVPSGAPAAYSGYGPDREQSLRQQYLKLAERRAERMDATELQRGIADMRRAFLIAELKAFADESPDEFDATRVEIATMALKAKDMDDIRTLAKELEATIRPGAERGDDTPQSREGAFDNTSQRRDRPE